MRILWVKVGGLWPPHTGGRLRSFHLVSELALRHRLALLMTHGAGDDPRVLAGHLPERAELISVPFRIPERSSPRFAMALARSWFSSMPVDLVKFRVPRLFERVRQKLETEKWDICVADFLSAAPNVPLGGPVPVILFAHNVEHMIWKRLCDVERRPWRRLLLAVEWRKMRRCEAGVCSRADLTVAVSEEDRLLLAACAPGAAVRAIPTGVDTLYFSPNGATESKASVVFTGSMDWYPNEDAILYFTQAILPRIRREIPGVSLTVVGRNPTARIRSLAKEPGIRVTGTVEDVRPYLGEASVCVVPLRVGGGTRLKIFEALAMGKAVVSTRIGAEGLALTSGDHFLEADGPDNFAGAVVSLLKDPARRIELGTAGRRLVEERYSWPEVARAFESRCAEAVKGFSERPESSRV